MSRQPINSKPTTVYQVLKKCLDMRVAQRTFMSHKDTPNYKIMKDSERKCDEVLEKAVRYIKKHQTANSQLKLYED